MTRALLLAAVAVVSSGCASSELRGLRNDLGRSTPGLHIGEGRSYSFGPFSLGAARLAMGLAGDDEDAELVRAALRGARRVQFAQYDVSGTFAPRTVALPDRVHDMLGEGWIPVVTVRDDDTVTWIGANDPDGAADEFLLITLTEDELTLAAVRGDLTEVARLALAQLRTDDGEHAALAESP